MDDIKELITHLKGIHQLKYNTDYSDGVLPLSINKNGSHYECNFCVEKFKTFYDFNSHMNQHYNNFVCEFCAKSFVAEKRLEMHLKTHESGEFPCQYCHKKFLSDTKRKNHVNRLHLKKCRSKCQHCGDRFVEEYLKLKHLKEKHGVLIQHKCDECQLVFDSRKLYSAHNQRVHLREHVCQVCGKVFTMLHKLKQHELVHTGVASFKCDFCSSAFKKNSSLKLHLKKHAIDKQEN